MHKKYLVITTLTIVIIVLCSTAYHALAPYNERMIFIGRTPFFVDVALTPQAWEQGLSHRAPLCAHCGMLFVFRDKTPRAFWMKDMRFDVDIIWLSDGEIVHGEEYVSHKTPQKTYTSPQSADMVLELPAGSIKKYHLFAGRKML